MWLLFSIYIITGLTAVNISRPKIVVYALFLTLGGGLVLFCTILLAAKMFLWTIVPELGPIFQDLLQEAIRNKNYVPTASFIGMRV
jgi:hypothetical protein